MSVPSAVALLTFAKPLVATLYHYGHFGDRDVLQTTTALMGWGVGLIGVVAIKVLAPGYFANQDTRTPVRIAIGVLVLTQVFNYLLVPYLQHAALTLSIGLGALVNAAWLLVGLMRRGSYRPLPGWGLFMLQVVAGSAVLAIFLIWAANNYAWLSLRDTPLVRVALLGGVMLGAMAIYFGALWAAGLKLRHLLRR